MKIIHEKCEKSVANDTKLPKGKFLMFSIIIGTLLYVGIVLVTKYAEASSNAWTGVFSNPVKGSIFINF